MKSMSQHMVDDEATWRYAYDRQQRAERFLKAAVALVAAADEVLGAWNDLGDPDLEAAAGAEYPDEVPEFDGLVAALHAWLAGLRGDDR